MDLLSPMPQQLFVERLDFAFVAEWVWMTSSFILFCKMIGYMLSACKHCPQSYVWSTQCYVPNSNLGIWEENWICIPR